MKTLRTITKVSLRDQISRAIKERLKNPRYFPIHDRPRNWRDQ